ncbi:glycine--tRNA ligase [Candidatus Woesearchaeota archaeon]|nr:glycine--tRNA ligase [Candidatus Woesearchaeota archaeon]
MKSEEILNIASKRGFFFPSGEIYGAKSGFWTYGHLGTIMKHKFEDLWRNYFLKLNDNYFEIEDVNILSEDVFKNSGHLKHFHDPLEENGKTENFNLMFGLKVGVKGDEMMYLRPETAQSPYIAFKNEFMALRERLPMGLAIIGKAFRNEINPRQGFFRLREFTQAELQIFFDGNNLDVNFDEIKDYKLRISDKEIKCKDIKEPKFYVYHLAKIQQFYLDLLGIPKEKFRFRKLDNNEKAFYNKVHYDLELKMDTLNGFKEIGGLHYRTDYDMKNHNMSINYDGKKIYPHVLELSFGVDRNIWGLMDIFYKKEKERSLFLFNKKVSPVEVAVFPLVNKDKIPEKAKEIYESVKNEFNCFYDSKGSIGKMYRRMDEIGCNAMITVDHESLKNNDVTLRDRDSMKQIRVKISELKETLNKFLDGVDIKKLGKLI